MKSWIFPMLFAAAMVSGSFALLEHARAQGAAEVAPMDASVELVAPVPTVAPDPGDDPGGFISEAFDAVRSKNGWMIGSVLVVLLSWALRFGVRRRTGFLAWFATDRGGVILTAIVATLGGVAHATAAGHAPGWPLLLDAAEVWLVAIGMYVAARRLMRPKDNVKFPTANADPHPLGGGKAPL